MRWKASPVIRLHKKRNKMSGFYAKRGRVTWLARNTTEFAKYHGPRFFPGHVFITTLKDSRGKDTRPITRIQPTGTKYQVIPQGEASFLHVACADRALLQ